MKSKLAVVFGMAMLATGCATVFSGTTDRTTLNSSPTGAEFTIKDENGKQVHHGTTPFTAILDRGAGFFDGQTYTIDFTAPGYQPQTCILDSYLNGWYFCNVILGGGLGMLIIDPATGAMWNFPDDLSVELAKAQ